MTTGYYEYDKPYLPEFKHLHKYRGKLIHPQLWDKSLNYENKRVIVIGSGATAATLVPELAKKAEKVVMLQR